MFVLGSKIIRKRVTIGEYELSVVTGHGTYSTKGKTVEVAIVKPKQGLINPNNDPVLMGSDLLCDLFESDDVVGHQTLEEVLEIANEVLKAQSLPCLEVLQLI